MGTRTKRRQRFQAPGGAKVDLEVIHRASGGDVIQFKLGSTVLFELDTDTSPYLVLREGTTTRVVSFGAADSGGTGYRALRIPNAS